MLQHSGWCEPARLAASLEETEASFVWLASSLETAYSGRYSYIAWGAEQVIEGDGLHVLAPLISDSTPLPRWFGYIGYEAAGQSSIMSQTQPTRPDWPALRFTRYRHVVRFDHHQLRLSYQGDGDVATLLTRVRSTVALPEVSLLPPLSPIASHMNESAYRGHVADALARIHAGAFYQVNLTRKLAANWHHQSCSRREALSLFARLLTTSPAPYSAFLAHDGQYILSSSPELFLRLDTDGQATTRPIKGTAPLTADAGAFASSHKDRAENLMIVDLMRHDLSACCVPGTVTVPRLWEVDEFSTLRHLSSTITGRLQPECSLIDLLHATFPPGSMTGAPKRAAMEWIARREACGRGVYSGALGWINGASCELSVVIRTLLLDSDGLEYQVGGGIVADSDPQREYDETCTKALGIQRALELAALSD